MSWGRARARRWTGSIWSMTTFAPALGWCMEHDTETALLLCHRLWRFWQRRGHLTEGLERAEAALALPDASAHPAARADALSAAAGLAYWRADADRARAHYGAEIEARTAIGDRAGLAEAEYGMSFTYSVLDLTNPETATNAKRHINAALELYQELGDDAGIGRCEWALANVLWGTRNTDEARGHALHALELFEASGDRFMSGWAAYTVGLADLTNDQDATGGSAEARDDAHRRFAQAMRTFREAGDLSGYTLVLDAFAVLAVRDGDRVRAARLTGVVGELEKSSGTALNPWNRGVLEFDPDDLRNDPSLADDLATGAAMSVEEAVAYALGEEAAEPVGATFLGRRGEVALGEDQQRVDDRDQGGRVDDHEVDRVELTGEDRARVEVMEQGVLLQPGRIGPE